MERIVTLVDLGFGIRAMVYLETRSRRDMRAPRKTELRPGDGEKWKPEDAADEWAMFVSLEGSNGVEDTIRTTLS